ncbi:hypothetical protein GA0074695_0003 [Micromonospora viridifaciens]|uniref:Transmembrane secretion effector n=1 Tax=Micromonospora viridifaciens TaxID=1881 RepID=A0A1C4U021_MICVI|nr:hypothetical protein GA0074695_0003 [Micromonospora viridifaciens]
MIAIRLLPALLLGPVAGVFADRFDRRWTMVICDLLRFVLFASIPLYALTGASGALVGHLGGDRDLPDRDDHPDVGSRPRRPRSPT